MKQALKVEVIGSQLCAVSQQVYVPQSSLMKILNITVDLMLVL